MHVIERLGEDLDPPAWCLERMSDRIFDLLFKCNIDLAFSVLPAAFFTERLVVRKFRFFISERSIAFLQPIIKIIVASGELIIQSKLTGDIFQPFPFKFRSEQRFNDPVVADQVIASAPGSGDVVCLEDRRSREHIVSEACTRRHEDIRAYDELAEIILPQDAHRIIDV